jgi:hypothetical protein
MKTTSIIIFLIVSVSGFSQNNDSTFLKFDLNRYNSLNEINTNHYFLEDSTKITFTETDSIYQIILSKKNSNYTLVYHYFKSSLILKSRAEFFQNSRIRVYKEYNEKGMLLTESDCDSFYAFTLQDLQKKIKAEFNLDIMDAKQGVGVNLITRIDKSWYQVYWPENNNPMGIWRHISIDGFSGEIISDIKKEYECKAK